MKINQNLFLLLSLLVILIPVFADAECTCDSDSDDRAADHKAALKLKIVAFAAILAAGAIGVCLPIAGKKIPSLSPTSGVFSVVKAFAGGVILATGAVHIAPDAFESLTSPCLSDKPWGEFPFAGLVMGLSMVGTMMIDVFAGSCYDKNAGGHTADVKVDTESSGVAVGDHGGATGTQSAMHGSSLVQLLRYRVIAQVLEMGILVHSIIIGVDMGASQSPEAIKPLVIAITFHQFFEGMGLGGCITQAKFKTRSVVSMILFFALTTPVGILIGIGISKFYSETSPKALIIEGLLNSAAAGILFYMSLVDVLSANFMSPKLQGSARLMTIASFAVLLGFACMALLAIWA